MSSQSPTLKAPFADNPTQGLIPLPITSLCLARMQGWSTIVAHLVRYLTIVVGKREREREEEEEEEKELKTHLEQEKRMAESLQKTSNDLGLALSSDTLGLFSTE